MSQASGAVRRARNPRSFRSAYNRGQRVAAGLALFSMLWFTVQPAAMAGTPVTLNGNTQANQPSVTGPAANAGFSANYWQATTVLGLSGGVVGGVDLSILGPAATRNEAIIGTGVLSSNAVNSLNANVIDLTNQANRPASITSPNQIAAIWTGVLNIGTADTYNFFTSSDDGTLLYIDGNRVVNNDFAQGTAERSGSVALTAGAHSIVVKFAQGGGGATVGAAYQSTTAGGDTGGNKVLIGSVANTVTNYGGLVLPGGPATTNNDYALTAGTSSTIGLNQGSAINTGTMVFGSNANLAVSGMIGYEAFEQQGAVTLAGTNVITVGITSPFSSGALTSANAVISGDIGGVAANLTKAGAGTLTLRGAGTYGGLTTVTGGALVLDAAGGPSVAGNLTINVAGSSTPNVTLLRPNQINSNAIVTMTAGVLDLGAFDQTVNRVVLNGQQIRGNGGTLTITDFSSGSLDSGLISARLKNLNGPSDQILKSTNTTLTLAGDNSQYNGLITVNSGTLVAAASHALGADANPATEFDRLISFSNDGQLQLRGNIDLGRQNLIFTGTNNQAINNLSGTNTLSNGSITLVDGANITSSGGNLVFGTGVQFTAGNLQILGPGDVTVNSDIFANTATNSVGSLAMNGTGTLTFGGTQQSNFSTKFVFNTGNVSFNGPQNFGALTVPVGKSYRFNSDPGTGLGNDVLLTVNPGSNVAAGFTPTAAFLTHITNGSTGGLLLTKNESAPIDLTGKSLSLGAFKGLVTYSGTVTPGTGGYRLGGGAGRLTVANPLAGNNPVTINGSVAYGAAVNANVGDTTVAAGGRLELFADTQLGATANKLILDGGTVQMGVGTSGFWNTSWYEVGNPLNPGGARIVQVNSGGGTIDVPATGREQAAAIFAGPNQITGTGTLTKTGNGDIFLVDTQNFGGNIVLAGNSGLFDLRGRGALTSTTAGQSITIGNRADLQLEDNGSATSNRQYNTNPNVVDRIADSMVINLDGGRFIHNSIQIGSREVLGVNNVVGGMSEYIIQRSGAAGGTGNDTVLGELNMGLGATLRVTNNNTLGAAGDNVRLVVNKFNTSYAGVAATVVDNTFAGGAITYNSNDFMVLRTQAVNAGIGGLIPVGSAVAGFGTATLGYNNYGAAVFSPAAADIANLNVAGTSTLGTGASQTLRALRFSAGGGQTLAFDAATQQLFITSGGVLSDNQNQARTIGAAVDSGQITAGASGATGPQQLSMHVNQNTLLINSRIIDNGTAPVTLAKDLDGTLSLANGLNSYSGGNFLLRGQTNALAAGSLGTGLTTVRNSRLQLNQAGSIGGSTGSYLIKDASELFFNSNADASLTATERYVVQAGSIFEGLGNNGANSGLNSFTRVNAAPTAGGQVQLAANSIVGIANFTNDANNATGAQTIKGLGANADLYIGVFGGTSANTSVTVGAGTPWKGLSGNRNGGNFNQGTIVANGDFYLQGLNRDNGYATFALGANGQQLTVSNNAGQPINAFIQGVVSFGSTVTPNLPADMTYVITPGAQFQPNSIRSLGSTNLASGNASILVQNLGTLNPGNINGFGPTSSTFLNGNVTVEAGGRLLLDDANGIGTQTAAGATWLIKKDGILDVQNNNQAFYGNSANRLINTNQFAFEKGAIFRMSSDNIYGMGKIMNTAAGGSGVIYELFQQSDRTFTDQTNPITNQREPENIRVADGGGLTNVSTDQSFRNGTGMGHFILGDGATLSATSQTFNFVSTPFVVEAGATINIGYANPLTSIDGHYKNGTVIMNQGGSTGAALGTGAKFQINANTSLRVDNVNGVPDNMGIFLAGPGVSNPVPALPDGTILGNGSWFQPRSNNSETIATLTGTGTVATDTGGTVLQVGFGSTGDFTFAGQFSNFRGGNFSIAKIGTSRFDITGTNVATAGVTLGNTSTGNMFAYEGTIALSGPAGAVNFQTVPASGGTVLLDNSGAALDNRLGGTGRNVRLYGGNILLTGNATTAVTENWAQLNMDANNQGRIAGLSRIGVQGAAPGVKLVIAGFSGVQDINNGAQAVFRGAGLGGTAGTYDSLGAYTPGVAKTNADGLVVVTAPNLVIGGNLNQAQGANTAVLNIVGGGLGSPYVGTRGDVYGSTDPNSQWGDRYVTQDSPTSGLRLLADSEYLNAVRPYYDQSNNQYNARLLAGSVTNLTGSVRVNSLTMQPGATINVTGLRPQGYTSSRFGTNTGSILVEGGAGVATINLDPGNSYQVNTNNAFNANSALIFHTIGDLTINGTVMGGRGLIKSGPGTLMIGNGAGSLSKSLFQSDDENAGIYVDSGKLVLNDSLAYTRNTDWFRSYHLNVNQTGTVDINGNDQNLERLTSSNPLPGMGGIVTNSSTTAANLVLTANGNSTFGGHINGKINFVKAWGDTQTLTGDNNYTGTTTLTGGNTVLRDSGTITSTSQININSATLQLDNRFLSSIDNRLPNNVDVNLRSGRIDLFGASNKQSNQELGTSGDKAVNLLAGLSRINLQAGNGGESNVTINNLVRSTGASVNFQSDYGTLGYPGNLAAFRANQSAGDYITDTHVYLNKINGVVTGASNANGTSTALTNNIIGGWAIANGNNFATYIPSVGVVGLGDLNLVGLPFVNYESGNLASVNVSGNDNVNDGSARTIGNTTVNALRIVGGVTMTQNAGTTLNLKSGGLLVSVNGNVAIGSAPAQGFLTTDNAELFLYTNSNSTTTINSVIKDNANPVTFVKTGNTDNNNGGTVTLATANTYTGGTYVSTGFLNLNALNAIPAPVVGSPASKVLTINGGTGNGAVTNQVGAFVQENVFQGINPAMDVVIRGGGGLRMFNSAAAETLNSITLDNDGGRTNASGNGNDQQLGIYGVASTTNGILNLTSPLAITAIDRAALTRPHIDVNLGTVNFLGAYGGTGNGQLHVVNAQPGQAEVGLEISAIMGSTPAGGLFKTGSGMMTLQNNTANQFAIAAAGADTTVLTVKEGIVRADAANALGNNHAFTRVENGGVLLGRGVTTLNSVTLNGGTLGTTQGSWTIGAVTTTPSALSIVNVLGNSTVKLSDYFLDNANQGGDLNVFGKLTGSGNLTVVGPLQSQGFSQFRLGNDITGNAVGANDYNGTITLLRGARLITQGTNTLSGSQINTAKINLAGGELYLRDQNGATSNGTMVYNNDVTVSANSHINVDRPAAANSGNVFQMGTLTAVGNSTLFVDAGNGYNLTFQRLAGSGTLTKQGTLNWTLGTAADSYAGFTGTLVQAGPQGMMIAPLFNNLGITTSSANPIANLQINGSLSAPLNTALNLDIANALTVSTNAGQVGNGTGGVVNGETTGAVAVNNQTNINLQVLRNNGIVGNAPLTNNLTGGGPGTIVASTIVGNGRYTAFNVPFNLVGTIKDDGATPTGLVVSGNNTVGVVTATTGPGTNTGANRVESGTLRLYGGNMTNPIGSGGITVYGSTASALSAANKTHPVAAVAGTLMFDAGAGKTITQTSSDVTNNGIVQVHTGTAVVNSISGGAARYVPGLLEGLIQSNTAAFDFGATRPANPGNFGIRLEPRMGQTNVTTGNPITGWGDNQTWVYTGQMFDADGKFSFIENIDDNAFVSVDGVDVLKAANLGGNTPRSSAYAAAATATIPNTASGAGTVDFGMGPAGDGWHNVEIRFQNGAGNGGAIAGSGFTPNYGFGLNQNGRAPLDGSQYTRPIDPGNMTLFRTLVDGQGTVQVDAGATLNAGQITQTNLLTMAAAGVGATVNITAPNATVLSNINNVSVTGTSGSATMITGPSTNLTINNLTVPSAVNLLFNTSPTATVTINNMIVPNNQNFVMNTSPAGGSTPGGDPNIGPAANNTVITGNSTGGKVTLGGIAGLTFRSNANQVASTLIAGNNGVVKEGAGTLSMSAGNTYTGVTDIQGGTIKLDPSVAAALYRLDASDAASVAVTGTKVTQWNDKTGNNRNFAQANAANQPDYVANGLNGKGVIRFNGTTQQLTLGTATTPQEVFIVSTPGSPTGTTPGVWGGSSLFDKGIRQLNGTNWQSPGADGNDFTFGATGGMFINGVAGTTFAGSHVMTAVHGNPNGSPNNNFLVTNVGGYTAGRFFNGDVAEVIAFDSTLSAASQQNIEAYLMAKWLGIQTTTDIIPNASTVNVGATGTLNLNGYNETIGAMSGAGTFAIGGNTLTTGANNAASTVHSGTITGAGNLLKIGTGTQELAGVSQHTGQTVVQGGTLRVSGSVASSAGVTVANAASTFEAASTQTVKQLNVVDGQAAVVGSALNVLKIGTGATAAPMTLTGTGKLNVVNGAAIIDVSAGNEVAALTSVRQLIVQGYNATAAKNDGNWLGNGITSSTAAADGSHAVGYALPSEIFVDGRTELVAGSTADDSSVLIRQTLAGDANLDGSVDFNDLVHLAQNYNTTVSATTQSWWFNGDFTYDGVTDFNDLVKMAQNYNTALPSEAIPGAPANFEADMAAAFSAVPEPGSLSVLALAGLALLRRRNRR